MRLCSPIHVELDGVHIREKRDQFELVHGRQARLPTDLMLGAQECVSDDISSTE